MITTETREQPTSLTVPTIAFDGKVYTCPYRDVLPPLTPQERDDLRRDIQANGVAVAVVITDADEVLDGHNRLEIAAELGLDRVPLTVLAGLTPEQKLARAVGLNLNRRHLTPGQRAMIAARIATAKEGRPTTSPIGGVTRERAADLLNVGPRSVDRARTVRAGGVPELVRAVESGAASVGAAAEVAKLPR